MDCQTIVQQQVAAIRESVGSGRAINALSGGVDSSVVTVLGHRALGDRLRTIFVDNALMRQDEPEASRRCSQPSTFPWRSSTRGRSF